MHHGIGLEDREPVVFCDGPMPSRGMDNGIVKILQLLYTFTRLTRHFNFLLVEVRKESTAKSCIEGCT